jgi:hypothetical protein
MRGSCARPCLADKAVRTCRIEGLAYGSGLNEASLPVRRPCAHSDLSMRIILDSLEDRSTKKVLYRYAQIT